jgi:hypothetical protein
MGDNICAVQNKDIFIFFFMRKKCYEIKKCSSERLEKIA